MLKHEESRRIYERSARLILLLLEPVLLKKS